MKRPIATDGGPVMVEAETVGPFWVHRSINTRGAWTVTHAKTGRAIGYRYPSKRAAKAAAAELRPITNWDAVADTMHSKRTKLSRAARPIVMRHGGLGA